MAYVLCVMQELCSKYVQFIGLKIAV